MPSTLPAYHDLTAMQGDPWVRGFRFKYTDTDGAVQLLDTTGWTGRMTIKESTDDTTALLSTDAGEIVVTTGILGTAPEEYDCEVAISDYHAGLLPAGLVGVYDLKLTDTSGREITFLIGKFCCQASVGSIG